MGCIRKLFHGVSLKQKIFWGYVVLIMVPLCAVTAVSSRRSASILEDKTQQLLGMTCEAVNEQYNIFMGDIDVISSDIASSSLVQEALQRNEYEVKNQQYANLQTELMIESYLQGIRIRKPGIHSILIYGNNTQHFSSSNGWSWDVNYDSREESWFGQAIEKDGELILTGVRMEHQLFGYNIQVPRVITVARVIKDADTFEMLGMLQINLDVSYLARIGMDAANEGYLGVFDNHGEAIFTNWAGEEEAFTVERISERTGWKTVYYAPKGEWMRETVSTKQFLWTVSTLATFLGLFFARLLTLGIMQPMKQLHRQMATVSQGDFSSRIHYQRQDEMGDLIDAFNQMTEKVHELIQGIQRKEEQRLKTEIDALQARINPHFLYNTLNTIRLTAMMHKDSEITEQLTAFVYLLKNASQNGGQTVAIRQEMEIIDAYCVLMKYRYGNFRLEIRGEEAVGGYQVLPFTIQPLVENAIFHGIAALKQEGIIGIAFEKKEGMIHMTVSDNGVGMNQEMAKRLLVGETVSASTMNHMGLKNVLDRLKLYFGEQSRMEVDSEAGKGTRIQLVWTAVKMEDAYAESDDCGG